jgi:hypothetical protein
MSEGVSGDGFYGKKLGRVQREGRRTRRMTHPYSHEFAFADHICQRWREFRQHDEEFRRRMRIFHGPSWEVPAAHPTIAAAAYPQVVALTRLLITPHRRNLAIDFWHAEHPVFVRELHQTVAPGLRRPEFIDEIASPPPGLLPPHTSRLAADQTRSGSAGMGRAMVPAPVDGNGDRGSRTPAGPLPGGSSRSCLARSSIRRSPWLKP